MTDERKKQIMDKIVSCAVNAVEKTDYNGLFASIERIVNAAEDEARLEIFQKSIDVSTFKIQPGDVIVIRAEDERTAHQHGINLMKHSDRAFSEEIRNQLKKNPTPIVVADLSTEIDCLNEEQLNACGWYKKGAE